MQDAVDETTGESLSLARHVSGDEDVGDVESNVDANGGEYGTAKTVRTLRPRQRRCKTSLGNVNAQ